MLVFLIKPIRTFNIENSDKQRLVIAFGPMNAIYGEN